MGAATERWSAAVVDFLKPATRAANACFGLCAAWPAAGCRGDDTVGDRLDLESDVYRKLMRPVLLAALNCDPAEGSARLAAAVIRETLARGGQACRPLIAPNGLGPALVDPAIAFIQKTAVKFGLTMLCVRLNLLTVALVRWLSRKGRSVLDREMASFSLCRDGWRGRWCQKSQFRRNTGRSSTRISELRRPTNFEEHHWCDQFHDGVAVHSRTGCR